MFFKKIRYQLTDLRCLARDLYKKYKDLERRIEALEKEKAATNTRKGG